MGSPRQHRPLAWNGEPSREEGARPLVAAVTTDNERDLYRKNADLADRVVKLERTVRSIGEVLAIAMAFPFAYAAGHIIGWLGLPEWIVGSVAAVVWLAVGSVFWKWYGRDLRP
jgi:hypothetical protein